MKQILPAIVMLLSLMLDTVVIPVFYYGNYLLMLSLSIVILIGILLGRMRGMFYGLVAGLILDVTAGTLGMKLFAFIAMGFLSGFLLDSQPEISRSMKKKERFERLLIRFIWIFVPILLYEVVMLFFQYAYNAEMQLAYVRDMLIRVLAQTLLTMLLYDPLKKLFAGGKGAGRRNTREENIF